MAKKKAEPAEPPVEEQEVEQKPDVTPPVVEIPRNMSNPPLNK